MSYENEKDSVNVTANKFLFYNLKDIDRLSEYIKSDLYFKYSDGSYKYYSLHFFNEDNQKKITATNLYTQNTINEVTLICEDTYTSFQFNDNNNQIEIKITKDTTDNIFINDVGYNIIVRTFIVDNITQNQGLSDLNLCIYNGNEDGMIYPFYTTSKYIRQDNLNYYGDLQTFENYFFYKENRDYYDGKTIRLFSRSENETALFIEFSPFDNDGIGKCRIKIRTCFENEEGIKEFKEYIISVDLYYSIDKLILWQEYFEENNKKLVIYYYLNDLENNKEPSSCPSISIFQNNMVINKIFPFSLVTYRFIYSVLTTHDKITKNNGTVTTPPYDKFYPDCLSITQNEPFKCSQLSDNSQVTNDEIEEILLSLGIQPDTTLINTVPSNALDMLSKNRVIYFLIELESINDGFDNLDINEKRYLGVLIYVLDGKKIIKNTFNNEIYLLDNFLDCFEIYFEDNENDSIIKEKDSFNKILIKDFLPVNTLYGQKRIIPVFFYYYNYYVSFYTNRQFEYSDELLDKITQNLDNYYEYNNFFLPINYLRRIRLDKQYIKNVNFIIKISYSDKTFLLSDLYRFNNGVINQIGISNNLDTRFIGFKTNKFDLFIQNDRIGINYDNNVYYSKSNENDYQYNDKRLTYNKDLMSVDYIDCYINQVEMTQLMYSQVLEIDIMSKFSREKYIEKTNLNTTEIKELLVLVKTKRKNGFVLLSDYYQVNGTTVTKMIINAYTNDEVTYTDEEFPSLFEIIKESNSLKILFNGQEYISYKKSGLQVMKEYNYINIYYNYNTTNSEIVTIFVNVGKV